MSFMIQLGFHDDNEEKAILFNVILKYSDQRVFYLFIRKILCSNHRSFLLPQLYPVWFAFMTT